MNFTPVESKPDFVALEKKLLDFWDKKGVVCRYLQKNQKSAKKFSFLDGPITANNPMGVHHAWGRTLKDLYQRFHNLKGEKQRFQNGFDCQGLWVEVEVEKELGFKTKKDIEKYGIDKFVQKCKDRVQKYAAIQTQQSQRLGYFMDWENSYYTSNEENNYTIWHFIKKCHEYGWLYQGRDSVPWCPRCGTAISQHEMLTEDYQEIVHDSIYFKLPLLSPKFKDVSLLVWTTTPWTIPGNVAAVVDPKLEYWLVETDKQKIILAKDRKEVLVKDFKLIDKIKGKNLIGLTYQAPFDDLPRVKKALGSYRHQIVPSDPLILPVLATEGTGIVHAATGAGSEDFALGKKLNLPVIEIIDSQAQYLQEMGDLSNKNAKNDPGLIIDILKNNADSRFFYKLSKFKHRYPACWRCKSELVWRVVDEWYIAMDVPAKDKDATTLRQRMIKVARKINWLPEFGLDRELDWLKNMHDWLISKKRYWGLALPIWVCSCGKFQVVGSKEELKEKAMSGWSEFSGHTPHRPWIDKVKIKCSCNKLAERIADVGNPWLDAGIVSFSTYIDPETKKLSYLNDKKYWQKWFPADFITESFPGQFKNWFYSLIAMATVLENQAPFKTVLGFGTLFGEDGRPMHKSWGNAIEFNEGADKIGVDVMRWLYATADPARNMLFGYNLADQARRQFHLLLWNIYKFFVTYALLNNFQPRKLTKKSNNVLDCWILIRLDQLVWETTQDLDNFHHHLASAKIQEFLNDFSLWYTRRSRDRVNPANPDKEDITNCLTVFHTVLSVFCRLISPLTPFISEEIYKNITGEDSVHLSTWPQIKSLNLTTKERSIIEQMAMVRVLCEQGHAARKKENLKVRQPLAKITVSGCQKLQENFVDLLKAELNIKQVDFIKKAGPLEIILDTKLTPALINEGQARDIIRKVQMMRKKIGLSANDLIEIITPNWPKDYEQQIKEKTLAQNISQGQNLAIKKISLKP